MDGGFWSFVSDPAGQPPFDNFTGHRVLKIIHLIQLTVPYQISALALHDPPSSVPWSWWTFQFMDNQLSHHSKPQFNVNDPKWLPYGLLSEMSNSRWWLLLDSCRNTPRRESILRVFTFTSLSKFISRLPLSPCSSPQWYLSSLGFVSEIPHRAVPPNLGQHGGKIPHKNIWCIAKIR